MRLPDVHDSIQRQCPSRTAGVALAAGAVVLVAGVAGPAPALAQPGVTTAQPVAVAVASTTFTSARHGWVLGAEPCPGGRCTALARTVDAGSTWTRVRPPSARLAPSGGQGVDEVQFADDRNGWAYAPQLHVTHDGGASWHRLRVPGGTGQVLRMSSGGGTAYAVVSSCVVGDPATCAGPAALWTAPVDSDTWTRTPVALPAHGTVQLTAAGGTAYVSLVDPAVTARRVFQATTDHGAHWSPRPSPCDPTTGERLSLAAASPQDLVMLCSTGLQAGYSSKAVFVSSDGARTSTRRRDAPTVDLPAGLAASGSVIAGRRWAAAASCSAAPTVAIPGRRRTHQGPPHSATCCWSVGRERSFGAAPRLGAARGSCCSARTAGRIGPSAAS